MTWYRLEKSMMDLNVCLSLKLNFSFQDQSVMEDSLSAREAGGKKTAMVLLTAIDNLQIVGISA